MPEAGSVRACCAGGAGAGVEDFAGVDVASGASILLGVAGVS